MIYGRPIVFTALSNLIFMLRVYALYSESHSRRSNAQYSSNWAGAVWSGAAGTFEAVTGTITVPAPDCGSSACSASAWVGIDGDTCGNAILQVGINMLCNNGEASYNAWYEWYPAYARDFSGITISAGDVLVLAVAATSTTTGIAEIQNLTTGQTVSKQLSSSSALCEQDAEWIVEDYEENGSFVPFCNFGGVKFTNAYATTSSGPQISPNGAPEIDIEQNGKVFTSVSESSSGAAIAYQ